MELKDVVSIGGKPGLHQIVGKRQNGLIVESIDDKKKRSPTSLTSKVSILDDIAIYTTDEDVPLREVLKSLDEKVKGGLELVTKKDGGEVIRDFFRKILPNFDEEQVYTSDIVKICNWYETLKEHIDFQKVSEETEGKAEETKADDEKSVKKSKPKTAKSAAVKKTATKAAPAKAPKVTQRKMS
ncbi:MAG: DUF5606 domain-containing protein [Flavobacteriales bacterium]|nr:DUF5606 domain-containing protein [Flavobacteriales bacterium]